MKYKKDNLEALSKEYIGRASLQHLKDVLGIFKGIEWEV